MIAVVEAKRLDEPLRKHATQIVNYANYQGIKFAVLTDGNQWEMYDVFPTRQGPLNDRKLLDVKLLSMTTTACALKLLTLWRANLQSDDYTQASKRVVGNDTSKPPPADPSRQWISFEDFDPPARTKAPSRIRFWDGSIVPVQHWRDILIECTRKVISTGHLTQAHLPLGRSNTGCYVNSTPKNPATGKNFAAPRRIDNTSFFVECHGNIQTIRGRVNHLWEFLNLSSNDLKLEYSSTEQNSQFIRV